MVSLDIKACYFYIPIHCTVAFDHFIISLSKLLCNFQSFHIQPVLPVKLPYWFQPIVLDVLLKYIEYHKGETGYHCLSQCYIKALSPLFLYIDLIYMYSSHGCIALLLTSDLFLIKECDIIFTICEFMFIFMFDLWHNYYCIVPDIFSVPHQYYVRWMEA